MKCIHCGNAITKGRSDRKFCDDKCKHAYHNNEKYLENVEINKIVTILKQNRRVLKLLLGEKEELYVGQDTLRRHGFNFLFHTHQIVSGQGNRFVLCFNYGYRVMDENNLKVVLWKKD
jgi:predicted nucleic acid-binding Zn ribbon protein